MNSHKSQVRDMFVDFQGKTSLAVEMNDGWPTFEDLDFSSFFNSISLEIKKVPGFVDAVTVDFTATTPVQKIASQITLMSSLQGYFNFLLLCGCGIPAIEMTGTGEDWKKLLSKLKVVKTLLEPITDHILIQSHANSIEKPSNKRIYKRDLRESKIRYFGQTITSFDWSEIYELSDVNEKYNKFNVSAMIECHFPNKLTNVRVSDKPWITQSLKSSISKRQKLFHKYGKNSENYKYWCNKVQRDVKEM